MSWQRELKSLISKKGLGVLRFFSLKEIRGKGREENKVSSGSTLKSTGRNRQKL